LVERKAGLESSFARRLRQDRQKVTKAVARQAAKASVALWNSQGATAEWLDSHGFQKNVALLHFEIKTTELVKIIGVKIMGSGEFAGQMRGSAPAAGCKKAAVALRNKT
jgi:hypothetical protein